MADQRGDTQFGAGVRTDLTQVVRAATAKLYTQASSSITDASNAWFGPLQPLLPVAPQTPEAGTVGRRFDYPTGYNLQQRPRGYEAVGFHDLRNLSRNCEIMRLVIETRKDQLAGLDWIVRVKADIGQDARRVKATADQTNRIKKIMAFMAEPDPTMGWDFDTWTRAFMEDHFVIDAPSVYRRLTKGGELFALELVDGSTISPLLTGDGRRPIAPDPAYQQIVKGLPMAEYSSDEMYYLPRNVSTNKVYGFSPVEQVLVTANIAIRRATFQLDYYTKGSQPDAFIGLPEDWNIDQIKTFQDWLDSLKSQRRVLRAVPGKFAYQPTKDPVLKDEYDDYLNRLVCYAFSVTPTTLMKMTNRATANSQHDSAIEEGAGPTMKWYQNFWTRIITREFDSPDLEFCYVDDETVDPKDQAVVDATYVKVGIYTIDEVREARGKDPIGGLATQPMVETATGYVTLGANVPKEKGGDKEPAPEPQGGTHNLDAQGNPVPVTKPGVPAAAPKEPAVKPVKKLTKNTMHTEGYKLLAPASASRKDLVAAKASASTKLGKLLAEVGKHAAVQLRALKKADDNDEEAAKLADAIDLSLMSLVATTTQAEATKIAQEAGRQALVSVGVGTNNDLVNNVFDDAVDYAKQRAAWLAGKKLMDDGSLVDNPDSSYSLEEATRSALRDTITDYLSQGKRMTDLADELHNQFAFSEDRAHLIAQTEVANANSAGALAGYRRAETAGVSIKKVWSVTDDQCCDECEANEAAGPIPLDDTFPSGDDAPLAHPNCRCVLLTAFPDDDGDDGDE